MERTRAIPTVQVYEGTKRDAWYWRVVAANGKIKADGGEDYNSKNAAMRGAETTVLPPYRLVVVDDKRAVIEDRGVLAPTGLIDSDNERNFSRVAIDRFVRPR